MTIYIWLFDVNLGKYEDYGGLFHLLHGQVTTFDCFENTARDLSIPFHENLSPPKNGSF